MLGKNQNFGSTFMLGLTITLDPFPESKASTPDVKSATTTPK